MTSFFLFASLALFLQEPVAPPKTAERFEVPFDILESRHMAVEIRVNGKGPYRVIFDTGAPVCLLSTKIGREADLSGTKKKEEKKEDEKKGDDKKEERRGRRAAPAMPMMGIGAPQRADEIHMGQLKARQLPVMVFDHPTVKAIAVFVGDLDGILGFPFFARYRVAVDYQQRKMFMEPSGYEPGDVMASMMGIMMAPKNKPIIKQMGARTLWGFEIKKEEGDEEAGVEVTKVWADGPAAAAGLKAGDRLLILDGHWADSREDCLRAAAGVKPGKAAELKVRRDGKEIRLSLRPSVGV